MGGGGGGDLGGGTLGGELGGDVGGVPEEDRRLLGGSGGDIGDTSGELLISSASVVSAGGLSGDHKPGSGEAYEKIDASDSGSDSVSDSMMKGSTFSVIEPKTGCRT